MIDLSKGIYWMFRSGLWICVYGRLLVYLRSILIQRKSICLQRSLATDLSWCRTPFFLPLRAGPDVRPQLLYIDHHWPPIIISLRIFYFWSIFLPADYQQNICLQHSVRYQGQFDPLFWPQGGTTTESTDWIARISQRHTFSSQVEKTVSFRPSYMSL